MQAVMMHRTGDPEVLQSETVDDPRVEEGQVVVDTVAAGLNFIDTYHRAGAYPLELPVVPGLEGAGRVRDVGPGVDGVTEGDRVAWTGVMGSYAERVAVPADKLVGVPEAVDLEVAAASMLQGMTAHYLATSTFPLDDGHTALVHAGAGGVGQLLVQIAKRRGAQVITTVSTDEKAQIARSAGADHIVRYTEVDVAEGVADITAGAGVDVVYDSVGADTFDASLKSLKPRGMLVLFGQSSGAVEPFDPQRLAQAGSVFLTRPSLGYYTATPEELQSRAQELFAWITAGELTVTIDTRFPLDQAADAHRYIEGRKTKGKVLLLP